MGTKLWVAMAGLHDYRVGRIARTLGVSRRTFQRMIQGELGITPREWIRGLKVGKAAELLHGGVPVKVIAARLGYSQSSHFARAYKEIHHQTPHESRV